MSAPNPGVFDTLANDSRGEDPLDARLLAELAERLAAFQSDNPLDAVLHDFRAAGFEREVRAWLAPGLSAPPTPLPVDAVARASAPDHIIDPTWIADVGARNRIDSEMVMRRLASLLPRAIKALTPRGEIPSPRALTIGLDALRRRGAR